MVCPNCHSDQIISVQDQHFCINCGQAVPEDASKKTKSSSSIAVQENGLPEGVTILTPPADVPSLVQARPRLDAIPEHPPLKTKQPKRKPGRPKSGRLDVPRKIGLTLTRNLPSSPAIAPAAPVPDKDGSVSAPAPVTRMMSDISPRPRADHKSGPSHDSRSTHIKQTHVQPAEKARKAQKTPKPPKLPKPPRIHKVGIPSLHYGHVLVTSLRATLRPRHVGLAALAAASLAAVTAYGIYVLETKGLVRLAAVVTHGSWNIYAELAVVAGLYYVGRSIGLSAIITSVIRDADHRPMPFTRSVGVAINTFWGRLIQDAGFTLLNLAIMGVIATLVVVGGSVWPINLQLQLLALFCAFLVLLYLMSALALSKGLARVAGTLTNLSPFGSAKLGWRLFSHRFELMGLRFVAMALELLLAVPLAVLAVALVVGSSPDLHLIVALAVGLVAWLTGALLGAGSAAWWATLYRNLVLIDHPDGSITMLSGRQPGEARPGAVALVVAISTLLVAASLALPWLKF
jgi:hypothetical protein